MRLSALLSIKIACLFALLCVVLGAFGAHALKHSLSERGMDVYRTAVDYQMFHSLGLMFLGGYWLYAEKMGQASRCFMLSAWFFIFGLVLFCGSLYALTITQIKLLGAITPLGGVSFIVAWGLLFCALNSFNKRS
jgi:uncharacterized membrane protein YgdD (TMEM256/DUF423 family)